MKIKKLIKKLIVIVFFISESLKLLHMIKKLIEQIRGFKQGVSKEEPMGWYSVLAIGVLLLAALILIINHFLMEGSF